MEQPPYNHLAQVRLLNTRVALIDRVFEYEVVVHVEPAEDARQSERVCTAGGRWLDVLGLRGGAACGEDHEGVFVEVGMHGREYVRLVAATLVPSSTSTSMSLWVASAVRSIHSGMRMGCEISKRPTLTGYGVKGSESVDALRADFIISAVESRTDRFDGRSGQGSY